MLDQRRRRWVNIKTTLGQRLVSIRDGNLRRHGELLIIFIIYDCFFVIKTCQSRYGPYARFPNDIQIIYNSIKWFANALTLISSDNVLIFGLLNQQMVYN